MKYLLLISIAFLAFFGSLGQKINVTTGTPTEKNKKLKEIEGTFTIGGKPFFIVSESHRMIVDKSAIFYPVEDNMNMGNVVRQDVVNIIDFQMELEKCLYLENIIVNNGKTFAFYTKRNGKRAKIFFVELEDDCLIDPEKATEIMEVGVGAINANTDFTVRQSPDGSKILLAAMVKRSQRSSDFIFKVYSAGMKSLLWNKEFAAPAASDWFKGVDWFNTGMDNNSNRYNNFLVNNEGRAYFLVNRTNAAETKSDFSLISIDSKGEKLTQTEVNEPGNWVGSVFFRLNNTGHANFFFFYSAHDGKGVVTVAGVNPINTNSLQVVDYDGTNLEILLDHEFTNEDQALFYPVKSRKPKTEYKISEFDFSNILLTGSGDIVMVMEKYISTVGNERPFSNKGNGYICILVFDKSFKIKNTFSFTSLGVTNHYSGGNKCPIFIFKDNLYLLYSNEMEQIQLVNFTGLETYKTTNLGAKFPEDGGYAVLNKCMLTAEGILVPVINDKEIHAAFIGL